MPAWQPHHQRVTDYEPHPPGFNYLKLPLSLRSKPTPYVKPSLKTKHSFTTGSVCLQITHAGVSVFPWPYPEYSLPIIQASMFPNHCISQGTLTCSGHDIPPQTWFSGLYVFVNNEVPRNLRGFSMSTYGAASSSTQHWAVDASPNLRRHYRSHGSSHCLPLITGGLADSKAILTAVTENWILIARAVTPPPAAHTPIFFFGTRTEVSKHSNTELDPCSLIL